MLIETAGDPSEDAAVATIVFLLDGKLVLLRPSTRSEVPPTDLKYDMRVLSDRVESFILLSGRGDEPQIPLLNGSIWAWDGRHLNVIFPLYFLIIDLDIPTSETFYKYPDSHSA